MVLEQADKWWKLELFVSIQKIMVPIRKADYFTWQKCERVFISFKPLIYKNLGNS